MERERWGRVYPVQTGPVQVLSRGGDAPGQGTSSPLPVLIALVTCIGNLTEPIRKYGETIHVIKSLRGEVNVLITLKWTH